MNGQFQDLMKITRPHRILKQMGNSDSLERCRDKEYFQNYKKDITYKFNTHGYRDDEWPIDLENVVWCVGDSATLGTALPFEDTWPQVLQKKIKKRCLNIGQEGTSNDTIRLRAEFIDKRYKPTNIIIMWSYLSRRRKNGIDMHYDRYDFGIEEDLKNFSHNFSQVEKLNSNIIHLFGSGMVLDLKKINHDMLVYFFTKLNLPGKDHVKKLNFFTLVDLARDGMHAGCITNQNICDAIKNQLKK